MMRKSNTNVKRKNAQSSNVNIGDTSSPTSNIPISENSLKRFWGVDDNEFEISLLEFDPKLCHHIGEYDVNQ